MATVILLITAFVSVTICLFFYSSGKNRDWEAEDREQIRYLREYTRRKGRKK